MDPLARNAFLQGEKNRDTKAVVDILTQPQFGGYAPEVAAQVVEPAGSLPEDLKPSQLLRFINVLKEGKLLSGDVAFDKLLYVPPIKLRRTDSCSNTRPTEIRQ